MSKNTYRANAAMQCLGFDCAEAANGMKNFGAALGRFAAAVECASLDEIENQAKSEAIAEGEA